VKITGKFLLVKVLTLTILLAFKVCPFCKHWSLIKVAVAILGDLNGGKFMPIQPTYPGVYIQEIPSGVRTITGVATSTAAFIGRALKGPINKAVRCTSYSDFLRSFGSDGHPKSDLKNSVKQFFDNGGSDCYVIRIAVGAVKANADFPNGASATPPNVLRVKAKTEGAWGNNLKISIVMPTTSNPDGLFSLTVSEELGLTVLSSEPTYVNLSMDPASPRYAPNLVSQSSSLIDVEALPTIPPITTFNATNGPASTAAAVSLGTGRDETGPVTVAQYTGSPLLHTGFFALDQVDLFNLMIIPADEGINEAAYLLLIPPASDYCLKHRAFLLTDAPNDWSLNGNLNPPELKYNEIRTGVKTNMAIFYPRVIYSDGGILKPIGASGMIAGLMARTDSQRGVWKAPAGTEADLRGAFDVEVNLTDNENGTLNKQGINCIRKFPNGIVSWGARTLDGADDFGSEWKYIPIRRLALFLEESLFRGTKWVVFEPNDEPLWAKIRLNLNAFMMSLFRQGAFQGSTPDKAFFVKCDGETTTQNDRNLGIVNIIVGFAPLKPAEIFII
jgi:phage tail sheath protein FI